FISSFSRCFLMKSIAQLSSGTGRKIGVITMDATTTEKLTQMFGTPEFIYPRQRDHAANASRKKHVQGELKGESQEFSAVYVLSTKQFWLMDGYTRAERLKQGEAFFPEGIQP